jgi:hypothetical protein
MPEEDMGKRELHSAAAFFTAAVAPTSASARISSGE